MGAREMTKAPNNGPPTNASTTDCQIWVVVNCTSDTTVPANGVNTAICLRVNTRLSPYPRARPSITTGTPLTHPAMV